MKEQEYYSIILKYLKGEASFQEKERVKTLSQNPAFKKILEEIKLIWKHPTEIRNSNVEKKSEALKGLNDRIDATTPMVGPLLQICRRKKLTKNLCQIAAFAIILLIPIYFFYGKTNFLKNYNSGNTIVRTTQSGEQRTIKLSDGTRITLNSETTITYPKTFREDVRQVYLEGEAFFEVAKDSLRPFLVNTTTITTKVLGTSFNTKAFKGEPNMSVSLLEGKVQVFDKSDKPLVVLEECHEFIYSKATNQYVKKVFDPYKTLAWTINELIFDGETLEEVVRQLQRWYGVKIVLKNDAIKLCRFKATFYDESLHEVLNTLKYAGNLHYKIDDDLIEIDGEGCSQ
ncbi:DUF4974 domain-containing protein [Aquimarina sp. ERC-38]|uniref:FecR family protein n=1 Tax=Aquimarina sp. ERC-38 TaxID=2949996 RepID=UPI0022478DD9|nr:FecR family protein [Aquimarina sp. ERC-38]UZO81315.1 DUF4974 domain-containing protein [Aquimarina sp. ERC-38]